MAGSSQSRAVRKGVLTVVDESEDVALAGRIQRARSAVFRKSFPAISDRKSEKPMR
jgi:hypothetical protein